MWADQDPSGMKELIGSVTGIKTVTNYSLGLELNDKVTTSGLDPTIVAFNIEAVTWIETNYTYKIDLGMPLAIYQGESDSGANLGSCVDGIAAGMSNLNISPSREHAAALKLLSRWAQFGVRNTDPVAAKYIWPSYSNYQGHCSAGELSYDGFLATTFLSICEKYLVNHEDARLNACDPWDLRTSAFAKSLYLMEIGYKAGLSDEQAFAELSGWNHDGPYRLRLIALAKDYNQKVGSYTPIVVTNDSLVGQNDEFQAFVVGFLGDYGLLPGEGPDSSFGVTSQEWLPKEKLVQRYLGVTQTFHDLRYDDPNHTGIDIGCYLNDYIYAVADGYVVETKYPIWDYSATGWGNVVWIDHGGGLWTGYYHMSTKPLVLPGQWVKKGDPIGLCGTTGHSTGTHLHFEVRTVEPAQTPYAHWQGIIDPTNMFGSLIDPATYGTK